MRLSPAEPSAEAADEQRRISSLPEHRRALADALREAQREVLIVSPTISAAAIGGTQTEFAITVSRRGIEFKLRARDNHDLRVHAIFRVAGVLNDPRDDTLAPIRDLRSGEVGAPDPCRETVNRARLRIGRINAPVASRLGAHILSRTLRGAKESPLYAHG